MKYAVINSLGIVLSRHPDDQAAMQQAVFFHSITRGSYSVVEES